MMKFRTLEISDPRYELDGKRFVTVKSFALKQRVDVSLYIPPSAQSLRHVPVIVLLHGVYGSHWSWMMRGGVHVVLERLIETQKVSPFILVMPSDGLWGDGSAYVPHQIQNFEKWIGEEVPQLTQQVLDQVSTTSPFFISGLSMGGYGALSIGMQYTHHYKATSAHSSITQFENFQPFVEEKWLKDNPASQFYALEEIAHKKASSLAPIRFDCGLEDELLEANRQLHAQLLAWNIPHIYEEFAGGHDWNYWHQQVERSILFFQKFRA